MAEDAVAFSFCPDSIPDSIPGNALNDLTDLGFYPLDAQAFGRIIFAGVVRIALDAV